MTDRDREARARLDALLWLAQLGDRSMTEILAASIREEMADVVVNLAEADRKT